MAVLVDTNVILDVLHDDSEWGEWSCDKLNVERIKFRLLQGGRAGSLPGDAASRSSGRVSLNV